jgi:probable HAF family extracellular repeat protein
MTSRLNGLLVASLVATALPALAQTYRITDLGAVAGDSVSKAYALNGVGQAAGSSSSPTGAKATLFSKGHAIYLGSLVAGDVSVATGINASAEVVGYEPEYSTVGASVFHAFVYSNGALHDIHSPSLFPAGTSATAINASGVVVGEGELDTNRFHAFSYSNGQMTDIGPPGSYQASAVGINDVGEIIGNAYFTQGGGGAFVYSNGQFTYLAAPSSTVTVSAFGISSTGVVAGTIYFNSGTPAHAAVYRNGAWTDLGGVAGASATHGTGVNASGELIATAYYPVKSYHPFIPGKHVAYIAQNGALVNLNTLIPANSGFTLTDSIAINDAGQILCDAQNTHGTERAVLLTPN